MFVDPQSFYSYYKNTPNFNIGIYGIYCSENNKIYIGQSTDIKQRFRKHKSNLRTQTHANKNLQYSWNKYETTFYFFYIEEANREELTNLEYYFYRLFNKNNLFNGVEPANYTVITEQMKKKISATLKERGRVFGGKPIKLSTNQVLEIKDLMLQNYPIAKIAAKYNLDLSYVYDIRHGKFWKHITGFKIGEFTRSTVYSDEDIRKIKLLIKEGLTSINICRILDKPPHLIKDIKRGRRGRNVIV